MAKKRGRETAYDMVLSLGAVFIAIAVVLILTWRPHHQAVQAVDYAGQQELALSVANWPVLIPNEIPKGYEVTSARFEPESYGEKGNTRWYLGFTNKNQEFISLWQSDGYLSKVQAAATNNGDCPDSVTIGGQVWQKCIATKPETRALVLKQDHIIYAVSGTASFEDLTNFTNSLIPTVKK